MDQLKNMATKLSGSSGDKASSNTGAQQGQGQNQDYVDKAFAAGQKKFGIPANEGVNERITDAGREQFEKATGKKVPEKFSN